VVTAGGGIQDSIAFDCKRDSFTGLQTGDQEFELDVSEDPPNGEMTRLNPDPVTGTGIISLREPACGMGERGEIDSW
jgi:hypothetical protein